MEQKRALLTPDQITELYERKINLPGSYFRKYERLPECPVRSWNFSWMNRDFPRCWCVLDFREWIEKHGISSVPSLGYTCASDPELEFVNCEERTPLEYSAHDLHALAPGLSGRFDLFIFNQTLEHLWNPPLAMENICRTLRPGGHVFTSVPTLNIPHLVPHHFGGFTPMGLAVLCVLAGLEVVELGQWGNFNYIKKLWKTHLWPDYNALRSFGRVANERENVVQCWILARKAL